MYCDRWTSDGTNASTWFISSTFTDYAQTVVMPYNIRQQSIKYTRIDIVYDVYYKISIKNATREKHGRGFRYTVTGQGKIPKD